MNYFMFPEQRKVGKGAGTSCICSRFYCSNVLLVLRNMASGKIYFIKLLPTHTYQASDSTELVAKNSHLLKTNCNSLLFHDHTRIFVNSSIRSHCRTHHTAHVRHVLRDDQCGGFLCHLFVSSNISFGNAEVDCFSTFNG